MKQIIFEHKKVSLLVVSVALLLGGYMLWSNTETPSSWDGYMFLTADIDQTCLQTSHISEGEVTEIARKNGLEEGVSPWRTRLAVYYKTNDCVWFVHNVVKIETDRYSSSSSGNTVAIDANTGKVIDFYSWVIANN